MRTEPPVQGWRCWTLKLAGLPVILLAGCQEAPPTPLAPRSGRDLGSQFDFAATGRIEGSVRWQGPKPTVPDFRSVPTPAMPAPYSEEGHFPNPNAPEIDPATNGVGDVVVYLRAVDPVRSKPWSHGTARVEVANHRCRIRQNGALSRIGIVRAGEPVELVAGDGAFWSLRGRGAGFFSAALGSPASPTIRRLGEPGLVELIGNSGRFWLRAYLFVAEHPYYARTDSAGRFSLDQVPEGTYELVCWAQNWRPEKSERDHNTTRTVRVEFGAPASIVRTVTVRRREASVVDFTISTADFPATSRQADVEPSHDRRRSEKVKSSN
jgi:hypothetical protein